jgi:hypothetical protein
MLQEMPEMVGRVGFMTLATHHLFATAMTGCTSVRVPMIRICQARLYVPPHHAKYGDGGTHHFRVHGFLLFLVVERLSSHLVQRITVVQIHMRQ